MSQEVEHPKAKINLGKSLSIDLQTAVSIVKASGVYDVKQRYVAPPRFCSICGVAEDEAVYGTLIDAQTIVADGEEGFADITLLLCDECAVPVFNGLVALGFKDHRHGGANHLEDTECPGYRGGECPTPSDWSNRSYVVPPPR